MYTLTVGSGSGTFSGVLQGSAIGVLAIVKDGAGTQTLSGANLYTGGTTVSGGMLLINNTTGSGLGAGAMSVATGATLGGTGAFSGAVAVAGRLAPGPVTAVLSTGPLCFGSGGTLALELNGATPGSGHDQVAVTGAVDLSGVALDVSAATPLQVGDAFTVVSNDGADAVVGTFASGSAFTTGKYAFAIDYAGGDGNDVVLTASAITNLPPANTVPSGPQTVAEDTALVFSTANGNVVAISDADAGSAVMQVALTATNGTVTFTGTISDINAALDGLSFAPTPAFNGAAALQITTDDLGNTGSDGPKSDTDTVSITVTEVNDAPAAMNNALSSVAEDSGARAIPFTALTGNDSAGPAN